MGIKTIRKRKKEILYEKIALKNPTLIKVHR